MKARDVVDAVLKAAKEHPLFTELLIAFCAGVVVGAVLF